MTKRTFICTVAIAGAVLVGAPSAYVLTGPKWAIQQVPFYVNPANNDVAASAATSDLQTGAAVWSQQTNANIQLYYAGSTSGTTLQNNGKNEVFFRNTSNGNLIAETYWTADAYKHFVDADIVFYDGGFKFFAGGSGCTNGIYIANTAAHEFGHALGMSHTSIATATMYPSSNLCSRDALSLDPDDIAGIEKLYPPAATNTAPTVTITSPSNNASFQAGTSVSFTGAASDQQDGNLSSRIGWKSSLNGNLGTGSAISTSGLVAGTHVITATVSDNAGTSASTLETVVVVAAALPPPPPPPSGIALSAKGSKVKGVQRVTLTWSGTTATSIAVYRNGALILTTPNDGNQVDNLNKKGSASYTYKVCAAGTTTCSPTVSVVF
jgi:hypothetical protein